MPNTLLDCWFFSQDIHVLCIPLLHLFQCTHLRQIVQENPRDANTLNQIGFLYEKLSNAKAANEQYTKVANLYAGDGFYLKAIACWKKVLKNDPALLDAHLNLGDLYAKQGLTAYHLYPFILHGLSPQLFNGVNIFYVPVFKATFYSLGLC